MKQTFYAAQLFDGDEFRQHQCIEVLDGKIIGLSSGSAEQAEHHIDGLLVPGYIDVQVNGGGGVLFNNRPSLASLVTMSQAHQAFGTTNMLPTLITDAYATMLAAADAMAEAIASKLVGVCGIHFEGPHLSQPKKGIHPQNHIRSITDKELALFTRQDMGKVIVTLAPENVSPDVISELVKRGVLVCLGHSNASAEQVELALQAGATGFTHLYNAMSPLTGREAGMVGTALLNDKAFCGLIVDHHHVSHASCKLAIKCKGTEQIMLVTDAMSHVGSEQLTETFLDMEITRQGDKLTIAGGTLAGSALDMASAVRNTHQSLGIPLAQALQMASLTPAKFLGLDQSFGRIKAGYAADWLSLNANLDVKQTWLAGNQIYKA
ncbi:N-acetylglucosamine-6-phosphate deacetylase [Paraglaciecola hydrolytica]|uniref:N-acetylgalactosamine-6-phosphate deacetylase n=1 Tax=Paraglaciecola hydrolytica TaxID=1799789 RepID=A0A136A3R8_9ALTE|nr:N-acetylglucosamine-6-phosphate deacetylase [Paraglaciecola hydrolytica]KXI29872.1 N-acetylglucosamine-6-phosphate deacetylase [Paraglaciecola hydrolytica]